jgi:cytoskeletal protein CcmA (bactofilin family)
MSLVDSQANTSRKSAESQVPVAIGARATIVGALHFDGAVVLDGEVRGEVRCKSLSISERGSVDGLIVAETVIVAGEVVGTIYAERLVLRAACEVEGDIFHRELSLEDGCYFEGRSRRHTAPLTQAPPYDEG